MTRYTTAMARHRIKTTGNATIDNAVSGLFKPLNQANENIRAINKGYTAIRGSLKNAVYNLEDANKQIGHIKKLLTDFEKANNKPASGAQDILSTLEKQQEEVTRASRQVAEIANAHTDSDGMSVMDILVS